MSTPPDILWLNLSRSLQCLNRPLLRKLSFHASVSQWNYTQTLDEPASLDLPLRLLHEYLRQREQPVHLAGHGVSGLLGILYARQYPQHVKSLTLLSVGPQPALSWQSHYYANRRLLRCDGGLVLAMMVFHLFGDSVRSIACELSRRLRADLEETPSLHSLLGDGVVSPGESPVPLLVCGSQDDVVISPEEMRDWQRWMNPDRGDRLWQCSEGRHFFHYFHAEPLSRVMLEFCHLSDATVQTRYAPIA